MTRPVRYAATNAAVAPRTPNLPDGRSIRWKVMTRAIVRSSSSTYAAMPSQVRLARTSSRAKSLMTVGVVPMTRPIAKPATIPTVHSSKRL